MPQPTEVESKDLQLFHYGKKGMKWGVTNPDRDGDGLVDGKPSAPPEKKQTRKERNTDILAARSRLTERGVEVEKEALNAISAKTEKGRANAQKRWEEKYTDWENHPDRQTAMKLTTGEKWSAAASTTLMTVSVASILYMSTLKPSPRR